MCGIVLRHQGSEYRYQNSVLRPTLICGLLSETRTMHNENVKKTDPAFEYSKITDQVYIGTNSCCQTHFEESLLKEEVRIDISLEGEKIDHPIGVDLYIWLPTPDRHPPELDKALIGIAALKQVLNNGQKAYIHWREVPAPKRGEIVRQIGATLRDNKDALGSLVALENGKIKAEGDGEGQEMIDMADFAVGQSRMLYGVTMPSERLQHRMYEQWHPLGLVGVITAFNFPVAVWAWNAFIAAITGDTVLWKPSPKTPLCAIAVQRICNRVLESAGLTGIFNLFITFRLLRFSSF